MKTRVAWLERTAASSLIGKGVATLCLYLKVDCLFPRWPYNYKTNFLGQAWAFEFIESSHQPCQGRCNHFFFSGEEETFQRVESGLQSHTVQTQGFLPHTDQSFKSVENANEQISREAYIFLPLSRVFHPKKWKYSCANYMCWSLFWWTQVGAGGKLLIPFQPTGQTRALCWLLMPLTLGQ